MSTMARSIPIPLMYEMCSWGMGGQEPPDTEDSGISMSRYIHKYTCVYVNIYIYDNIWIYVFYVPTHMLLEYGCK
jgi:hypothetical protein